MKPLKRMNIINQLQKVNNINTASTSDLVKKVTITQSPMKL